MKKTAFVENRYSLIREYVINKTKIEKRIAEFKSILDTCRRSQIFEELVYCIFTPQSKAESAEKAIKILKEKKLLNRGRRKEIQNIIGKCGVRFKKNKTEYLIRTRKFFPEIMSRILQCKKNRKMVFQFRLWLVKKIYGLGYKEASHFLRNIGLGENLAILDRHILKNLKIYRVIKKIPKHLSAKKYIEIENKMKIFSSKVGIPLSHLDLLFWMRQTGKILK